MLYIFAAGRSATTYLSKACSTWAPSIFVLPSSFDYNCLYTLSTAEATYAVHHIVRTRDCPLPSIPVRFHPFLSTSLPTFCDCYEKKESPITSNITIIDTKFLEKQLASNAFSLSIVNCNQRPKQCRPTSRQWKQ